MEEKYLPIGTVCTINNYNKKVMITSYFSNEYNNGIVTYDYKGCVYPEGLLLPSRTVSFNHSDIVSVDYIGFKNNEFDALNNNLKNNGAAVNTAQVSSGFQFDENGVVLFDPDSISASNATEDVANPFQVSTPAASTQAADSNASIFGQVQFDENGFVIFDPDAEPENGATTGGFVFDENGFVVSDPDAEPATPVAASGLQFDANGVVIADPDAEPDAPVAASGLQFDANGVVIADPDAESDSSVAASGLQFDANGVVIADPDAE